MSVFRIHNFFFFNRHVKIRKQRDQKSVENESVVGSVDGKCGGCMVGP